MKQLFLVLLIVPLLCLGQAPRVRSLFYEQLHREVSGIKDTLVVVNFWATWCKPCVEELPVFDRTGKENVSQKLKMILVNLDFNSKVGSVVEPYIRNNNIGSAVWHISNTDPNEWIDRVDSSWSGAIPATVMYRDGKKVFFKEGQLSETELKEDIHKFKSSN